MSNLSNLSNLFKRLGKIISVVLFGLCLALPVLALQITYPDWFPIREQMLLTELVVVVFKMFLVISGITAFLVIVAGGFRYLTSAGDPGKMADAKNQLFSALLGLVLLLGSYLILNTINPELVALREPTMERLLPFVLPAANTIKVVITEPVSAAVEDTLAVDAAAKTYTLQDSLALTVDPTNKKVTITGASNPWEKDLAPGTTITINQTTSTNGVSVRVVAVIGQGEQSASDREVIITFTPTAPSELVSAIKLLTGKAYFEKKFTVGGLNGPITEDVVTAGGLGFKLTLNPIQKTARLWVDLLLGDLELAKITIPIAAISRTVSKPIEKDYAAFGLIKGTLSVTAKDWPEIFCGRDRVLLLYEEGNYKKPELWCYQDGAEINSGPVDVRSFNLVNPSGRQIAVKVWADENFQGDNICFTESYKDLKGCVREDQTFGDDHWEDDWKSLKIIETSQCPSPRTTYESNGSVKTAADKCPANP